MTALPALTALLQAAATVALVAAAACDVATRLIPNRLVVAVAISGLALRLLAGDLVAGLATATAVFAAAMLCWQRRWIGGGDAKLLGTCALLVLPADAATLLLGIGLAGGVLAALYLLLRCIGLPPVAPGPQLMVRILRVERWRIRRGGSLPYGCAICAGALFTLFGS